MTLVGRRKYLLSVCKTIDNIPMSYAAQRKNELGIRVRRQLGCSDYASCLEKMRAFTDSRTKQAQDEIWLTTHPPVFTLGQAGKPEHLLQDSDIPLVRTDRGGQITYHGPGQAIAYVLVDLRRLDYGVRTLVRRLEQGTIEALDRYCLEGKRQPGMPGVYTKAGAKIAALGLRVRHGCTYHGISLNLDCDLQPYSLINPCGHANLAVTSLRNEGIAFTQKEVTEIWLQELSGAILSPS